MDGSGRPRGLRGHQGTILARSLSLHAASHAAAAAGAAGRDMPTPRTHGYVPQHIANQAGQLAPDDNFGFAAAYEHTEQGVAGFPQLLPSQGQLSPDTHLPPPGTQAGMVMQGMPPPATYPARLPMGMLPTPSQRQVTGSGHVHGHGQNRTSPTSAFPEDALAPGPAGPYQHGFHHVPQGLGMVPGLPQRLPTPTGNMGVVQHGAALDHNNLAALAAAAAAAVEAGAARESQGGAVSAVQTAAGGAARRVGKKAPPERSKKTTKQHKEDSDDDYRTPSEAEDDTDSDVDISSPEKKKRKPGQRGRQAKADKADSKGGNGGKGGGGKGKKGKKAGEEARRGLAWTPGESKYVASGTVAFEQWKRNLAPKNKPSVSNQSKKFFELVRQGAGGPRA